MSVKFSILIVSHNRKEELLYTLQVLRGYTREYSCEILVFLDGCDDGSKNLIKEFPWVQWLQSKKKLGASPARYKLYKESKGHILIGFDDDAHPLQPDFLEKIDQIFSNNPTLGIIAFKELKGVYSSDSEALKRVDQTIEDFYCAEFVGCGFAIKRDVYNATSGFPIWMDIYGEESCVALETLANGYEIIHTNSIAVNHRIDSNRRLKAGRGYYRFGKQLRNSFFYFVVYYKKPTRAILKLLFHNFKKYALKDFRYFIIFFKELILCVIGLPYVLNFRKPISESIIEKKRNLTSIFNQ